MEDDPEIVHKVVDVLHQRNEKTCVTKQRHNVNNPEISFPQVGILARKKEDERFIKVAMQLVEVKS